MINNFFIVKFYGVCCVNRWGSKLDMLLCLRMLKKFCQSNSDTFPELFLAEDVWAQIDRLIEELVPSKICTKVLQAEQLTVGDFFGTWLKCKFETQKLGSFLLWLL